MKYSHENEINCERTNVIASEWETYFWSLFSWPAWKKGQKSLDKN